MIDLSVIIPAYNESARIGPALDTVLAYLRAQVYAWELIVVDDGSRDATVEVVN
ncbi:MAG: glycosyltransferase, partial [Chloroflexi bacterium]|nr:glycosyltransferase [Chloroflexota bacterium]